MFHELLESVESDLRDNSESREEVRNRLITEYHRIASPLPLAGWNYRDTDEDDPLLPIVGMFVGMGAGLLIDKALFPPSAFSNVFPFWGCAFLGMEIGHKFQEHHVEEMEKRNHALGGIGSKGYGMAKLAAGWNAGFKS